MLQATCERLERRVVELSAAEGSLHAELAAARDAAAGREALQLRVQSLEEGQRVRVFPTCCMFVGYAFVNTKMPSVVMMQSLFKPTHTHTHTHNTHGK